jgi:hypothetical protein
MFELSATTERTTRLEELVESGHLGSQSNDDALPWMVYETFNLVKTMPKIELKSPVKTIEIPENLAVPRIVAPYHSGEFVAVRPIAKNGEEEKTYFGIMLGDMNIGLGHRAIGDEVTLIGCLGNPAIFVPKLAQLVYGAESFWKIIQSEEQLTALDDDDLKRWAKQIDEQIRKRQEIREKYVSKN